MRKHGIEQLGASGREERQLVCCGLFGNSPQSEFIRFNCCGIVDAAGGLQSRGNDEDACLPGGWFYRLASCSSTYVRERLISAVTALVLSRMGIPRGTGCMKISVHPW